MKYYAQQRKFITSATVGGRNANLKWLTTWDWKIWPHFGPKFSAFWLKTFIKLGPNPARPVKPDPNLQLWFIYNLLGVVHKGRPHKIAKKMIPSPLISKMFALIQPPCPCGHTKFQSFCTKCVNVRISTLVRKMSALDKPSLTADVFYGQPLIR